MEKKKILPAVIAVVLMALIIVGAVGVKLYEKYSYSKETMDLSRYYGIEKKVRFRSFWQMWWQRKRLPI